MSAEQEPAQPDAKNSDNRDTAGQGRTSIGQLVISMVLYTLARLGLVVVVAAVIMGVGAIAGVTVPILVAAAFGVLIALPLGMVLFKKLRVRVNGQIAAIDADRRQRHEELQSKLRGQSTGR
ncbi:DUF4229 domain-containing protein [Gordonia sp. NPDC003429]